MTRNDLILLAKPLYKDDGPNQWPHIMRVLAQADKIAENRGRKLDNREVAAVLLHDSAKYRPEYQNMDHGEASAEFSRKILQNKLNKRTIQAISNAIAQHNYDKQPNSQLAELLMASDANIPDLGWFLRKSYNKVRTAYGYSEEDAVKNAYEYAKRGTPLLKNKKYRPKPWLELFGDDLQATERKINDLKLSQVKKLIEKYEKEHPGESNYT
jgi:HD superfamily phosphohydrolase YqeK